ncbi:protein of unknown function [Ruminococcaceae bacterium BL-4]|nr:protein of unknown function [Ruminococcaceae bacterium BL-4]
MEEHYLSFCPTMRISILGNNYRLKNQNHKDEKLNGKIKKSI